MNRKPTLREEQEVFHKIMHIANMMQICGKDDHFKKIVWAMDDWSYAHRVGNGEPTDSEQQKIVNRAFWRLKEIVDNP
jgi:hypothetical protein